MLKANKTVTYSIPQVSAVEPQRVFVRTGTYPDGNCFIHALLRAIDSNYRKQATHFAHVRMVDRFRKELAEWLTEEQFRQLGNGEQLRIHFLAQLNQVLTDEYANGPAIDPYIELIHELIPLKVIEHDILPQVLRIHVDNFYVEFGRQTEKYIRGQLGACEPRKVDNLCRRMYEYFIALFRRAHTQSHADFQSRLRQMGEYVDALQMEAIARFTGYNFMFLREREQEPYAGLSHVVTFDCSRESLAFLWVNENHFEVIGELEDKNLINRVFAAHHPLIHALSDGESATCPVLLPLSSVVSA